MHDANGFRFGDFLLLPRERRLLRAGDEVALIPRYFDLLLFLVQERERVVSREEIFARVWRDVVVSDGALSQAVRTLRRALGDDPRSPRFLRTVSRFGYQFAATDVRVVEGARAGSHPSRALSAKLRRALTSGLGASLGGLVAGVAAAGLLGLAIFASGTVSWRLLPVLIALGAAVGALGGGGVGLGVAAGALWRPARLPRALVLAAGGAIGGGLVGTATHWLGLWTVEEIFGRRLASVGGGLEGLAIGAAVGLGLALMLRGEAVPGEPFRPRLGASLVTGLAVAAAAIALTWAGRKLSGASLELVASTFGSSRVGLDTLGRLLGEGTAGWRTQTLVAGIEGLLFGIGLSVGVAWAEWGSKWGSVGISGHSDGSLTVRS